MKNVTGYDVARGLTGSWGTLAVLTEVTFKVIPWPETAATVVYLGLPDDLAIELMSAALAQPVEVSGAVHLQAPVAARLNHPGLRSMNKSVTALRLENFASAVSGRKQRLKEALKVYGKPLELDHRETLDFWGEMRRLSVMPQPADALWRISTTPTTAPKIVAAIKRYMPAEPSTTGRAGSIWLEVPATADAGTAEIRRAPAMHGGHATLIRAEPNVRAAVEVFQPLSPPVERLTRGLKAPSIRREYSIPAACTPICEGHRLKRMQTNFTPEQLRNPRIAEADEILRRCVHCGLCTATCPTYVLLGDERDSPRGRIYLIKDMLEDNAPASPRSSTHLDRCLSCLSCMTTCPSGVDYMHLVDHRAQLHRADRAAPVQGALRAPPAGARAALPRALPPGAEARAARARRGSSCCAVRAERARGHDRAGAARVLPPSPKFDGPGTAATKDERRARVILLAGCAQQVLRPDINDATIRLLARRGVDVVVSAGAGCCGALDPSPRRRGERIAFAKRNVDAWSKEMAKGPVDAIVVNASGCGTTVKDYGHLLKRDPEYAERAARISDLAHDVSEFVAEYELGAPKRWSSLRVAYHSGLLAAARPAHQGGAARSAASRRASPSSTSRKRTSAAARPAPTTSCSRRSPASCASARSKNIKRMKPDVVAAGNIGCITQLAGSVDVPVVHTVELLDWAYGGPVPPGLEPLARFVSNVPEPKRRTEDFIHA